SDLAKRWASSWRDLLKNRFGSENLRATFSDLRRAQRVMRKAEAQLLTNLQQELEEQRLHMVYQPKVTLREGKLARVEALVRWEDSELGTIEPSRFVPVAEQHGLIDDLTQWGLRTILRQWLDWCEEGID